MDDKDMRKILLFLAVSYYVVTGTAGTFQVINLSTNGPYAAVNHLYPVGTTVIETELFTQEMLELFTEDFNFPVLLGNNYTVHIKDDGTFEVSGDSTNKLGPALEAGIGAGLLWFGFGWIYRLCKKTSVTDF